jgi:hypothetical protein
MQTNELPPFDQSDNETNCCPRFHPEAWDNQELHFDHKPFVRASTISAFHIPLNMGSVYARTVESIRAANAEKGSFLVLSRDESAWHGEHLFAVAGDVPGADMVHLSGDFLTKVFEGPFSRTPQWCDEMSRLASDKGRALDTQYFFYTTCPRCAKHYGKNYVVGIAKVIPAGH